MRLRQLLLVPLALALSLGAGVTGCAGAFAPELDEPTVGESSSAVTLTEGFEGGSKTSYAAANVTLGSGVWRLDDALIGTLATDVRTGAKSARLRNSGHITMQFDRTAGAGTVTMHYASYGSDASGTWGLFASTDGGGSWSQVGASRSTSAGAFSTATFAVNLSGTVRLDIRKLDGGGNRINIDDIAIGDFSGGGGGSGSDGGGGDGSGAAVSKHTTMGLPAAASSTTPDAFLSVKSGYVESYNAGRKVPNWVSWEINTSYLGTIDRSDDFRVDDTFPAGEAQATLADYSGSGYDRGHMCPSADRTKTTAANQQTFYLTNMVPQAGNNNRGPWVGLENYLRDLVSSGKEIYVIAGGTFSAGSKIVGDGLVVPDKTWKVAIVMDSVGAGPGAVTTSTRVIAVMMPNDDSKISLGADWKTFRVSVDAVEAATGYDLLSDVATPVQAVIEARVDNQ
ncbi:MAG TPA: DNA/RNA non-specific endonuclease [Kofleriaceae bacterium]